MVLQSEMMEKAKDYTGSGEKAIFLLQPICKEYIWGKENWLFSSLHSEVGEAPFLIKEILAKEALSLQVHPEDDFAGREEGSQGKTEMWYILDCSPEAYLYYGLKHKVTEEELAKRIVNGTILEICRKVPVNKGDVFYLPAGIIHAIGPGIRLLEVQQNSNLTYRIYDYGRKNEANQLRPLHIRQALQVSSCHPPLFGHEPMNCRTQEEGYYKTLLVQCPYFKVTLYEVLKELTLDGTDSQTALVVLEGKGELKTAVQTMRVEEGDTLLLSPLAEQYKLTGKVTAVVVHASPTSASQALGS